MTYLNKNCLLRFVTSILSKSITWISLKPDKAKSLRISQPRPPAPNILMKKSYVSLPITRTLAQSVSMPLSYRS